MKDPIAADCRLDYLPAAHSSGNRRLPTVKWIVLHSTESPNAQGSARWFQNPDAQGSTHLVVDGDVCYRCLTNETIPWGAASAFGANTHGFHIEQAGYARWSAVIWSQHRLTLQRAAYKTAFHCHLFGIPPVWVPAKDLPRKFGVTSHREVSAASRRMDPGNKWRYSHSDPGAAYPVWLLMRYVRGYYDQLGKKASAA